MEHRNTLRLDSLGGLEIDGADRTLDVDLGGDCLYVSMSPKAPDSKGWITLTFDEARALASYLISVTGSGETTPIEGPEQA